MHLPGTSVNREVEPWKIRGHFFMGPLSVLLGPRLSVLDDERGEGAHWRLRVLDRVRKLYLRAPLFGGHLAAHITPRALVEEHHVRVLLKMPVVRPGVGPAQPRGHRGAYELGADSI